VKRSGLSRKTELKRGAPMERGPGPASSREKTAAFVQRGREKGAKGLREAAGRGAAREAAARRQEGPLTPYAWRVEVFTRAVGRCSVSGARTRDADDRAFHAHHAIPKQELRRPGRDLRGYVWHPDNGVWLSETVHMNHEGGDRRVPRSALPESVWRFAALLDDLDGTSWATVMVERLHPA
jgi:hypothetical protein